MVEFAGFQMPVQYGSILAEHKAVRERAGLFDVSHMGQIHVRGPGAAESLERLLTCPIESLRPGRVRYGLLCNEQGGVVDDVTVYRLAEQRFFLCVNASNVEKDFGWIANHVAAGVEVKNRSVETGLLALQGPAAAALLSGLTSHPLDKLPRFAFQEGQLGGTHALISRTGYTGSDGFEIYLAAAEAPSLFETLLAEGAPVGMRAAGLGARDTLRLEAALPLYGHELDDKTSPLEARLDRFVKLDRGGFLGAEALAAQRSAGLQRILMGFVLEGRGVARASYPVLCEGRRVGSVTSGAPSPTLGKSIGLGYVPPALAAPGTRLEIAIRSHRSAARVTETPFVKHPARKAEA
jgi:aminomethyltransferase